MTTTAALPQLHASMGHTARMLLDIQKMRVAIGNRISAAERDGLGEVHTAPLQAQAEVIEKAERGVNTQLERLAKQHPMKEVILNTPGISLAGFGRLLGITGPLDLFPTPSHLWSYLGMSVVDGKAPKRAKGQKAKWSPAGRVLCHQLGEAIVKLGRGPYREAYDRKKAEYLTRERTGPSGCPFGHEHSGLEREMDEALGWNRKTGNGRVVQCVKTASDGKETSAHCHNAAMRYAVKLLLKDLWCEWRDVMAERVEVAA